jgi:hypothetical protein
MCSASAHVRFVPKADIGSYSITSSARPSSTGGKNPPVKNHPLSALVQWWTFGSSCNFVD